MPVYEYLCTTCGKPQDRLLPIAQADDPGGCDDCAGTLKRRFSRVAVRLEGWGFAATDGMVPDRPGRGDYKTVRERAERIAEGDASSGP